jgi:hypothetical protein
MARDPRNLTKHKATRKSNEEIIKNWGMNSIDIHLVSSQSACPNHSTYSPEERDMFLYVSSIQLITAVEASVPLKPIRLRYTVGVRTTWTAMKHASGISATPLLGSMKAWNSSCVQNERTLYSVTKEIYASIG